MFPTLLERAPELEGCAHLKNLHKSFFQCANFLSSHILQAPLAEILQKGDFYPQAQQVPELKHKLHHLLGKI